MVLVVKPTRFGGNPQNHYAMAFLFVLSERKKLIASRTLLKYNAASHVIKFCTSILQ